MNGTEELDIYVEGIEAAINKSLRAHKMLLHGVFDDLDVANLLLQGARSLGIEFVEYDDKKVPTLIAMPGQITPNIRHLLNLCQAPLKELLEGERLSAADAADNFVRSI